MADICSLSTYDAKNPHGAGTSPNEKLFLWGLLSQCKFSKVLEIGVSRGHMTLWFAFAQSAHDGRVVSVDNWSMAHGGASASEAPAQKRLKDNKLDKFVTFCKSDSAAFLERQKVGAYDFVWIDGDHSYDKALLDIELALALKPKMIGVHDVNQQYSGPRNACRYVEEMYGREGAWVMGLRGIWLLNV